MRPLMLEVDGLRSYRHPVRVDFSDVTLMAIVGDTGSGKSSLLEAITYGLYAASTWSGQPGDLIADGTQTMRVELTFLAGGQRWRATRSMSRTGYPPPVHRLECLDEPGRRFDGRTQVNDEVERIVGLDYRGFLRSVILPQGRFADLLLATDADRTRILKNLFRVDELEQARQEASRVLERLDPAHADLRERRAGLLADPVATEAAATLEHQRAQAALNTLTDLQRRLGDLAQEAEEATRSAAAATRLAEDVADGQLQGGADQLQAVATVAAELAGERRHHDAEGADATDTLEGLRGQLEQAEAAGEDLGRLNAASSTLDTLTEELPDIAAQLKTLDGEHAELVATAEQLSAAAADVQALSRKAIRAAETAQQRREAASQAVKAVQAAQACIDVARDTQARLQRATQDASSQQDAIGDLEAAKARTVEALQQAESTQRAAKTELERQQRADSAAHAVHGLGPGDTCPVCARALPATFRPPAAPSMKAARVVLADADHRLAEAGRAATRADADIDAATRRLRELRGQQERMASELQACLREAATALGQSEPAPDASILERTDEQLLAGLTTAAQAADQAAQAAEDQAGGLRDQATGEQGRLEAAQQALEAQRRNHQRTRAQLRGRYHTATRRAARLPAAFQPTLPAADDLLAPDRPHPTLDVDQLTAHRQTLLQRLTIVQALDQACQQQTRRLEAANAASRQLDARYQAEVDGPLRRAQARLGRLAERATRTARHLEVAPPRPAPDSDEAAELAGWARDLEAAAADLRHQAEQAAGAATEQASKATNATRDLLASHGLDSPDALDAARLHAAATAQQAKAQADEASRQCPLAADLDRRLQQGGAFLAALRTVRDLLGDGRFIGYVVRQRQQALLAVASRLLGELTGQRYGFAADFQVVDRVTGQPRSPRTLSGGESFLASLALALGMVELAGRAGGRLDALFLDEGFGGLDAGSLDAAIDALESRAATGRLVAVISHVRLVAERIADVLAVRATPAGSQTAWLSRTERAEVVDQELAAAVEAGLLA
jgi:exonuclease SbcC